MSASKIVKSTDFPQIQTIANLQEGVITIEKPQYQELKGYSYNFQNKKNTSERPQTSQAYHSTFNQKRQWEDKKLKQSTVEIVSKHNETFHNTDKFRSELESQFLKERATNFSFSPSKFITLKDEPNLQSSSGILNKILKGNVLNETVSVANNEKEYQDLKNAVLSIEKEKEKIIKLSGRSYDVIKKAEQQTEKEFKFPLADLESRLKEQQESKTRVDKEIENQENLLAQCVEQKCIIRNDLQSLLVQRDDLKAQYDDIHSQIEEFKQEHEADLNFIIEEEQFQKEIAQLEENKKSLMVNKNNVNREQENVVQLLIIANKNLYSTQHTIQQIYAQKKTNLEQHKLSIQEIEKDLNAQLKANNLNPVDSLFMEGCKGYSQTLEKNILNKELEILSQDLKQSRLNYDQIVAEIKQNQDVVSKLDGQHSEEAKILEKEFENQIDRRDKNSNTFKQRQQEIQDLIQLFTTKEYRLDWSEHLTPQALIEFFQELTTTRQINKSQSKLLDQALQQYLSLVEQHDVYLCERQHESIIQQRNLIAFSDEVRILSIKKKYLDQNIQDLESQYQSTIVGIKAREQSMYLLQVLFQQSLVQQTDEAFNEYYQQQYESFQQLARTYGNKERKLTKEKHHAQFMEMNKNERVQQINKYKFLVTELVRIQECINKNANKVDNDIPNDLKPTQIDIQKHQLTLGEKKRLQQTLIQRIDSLDLQLQQSQIQKQNRLNQLLQSKDDKAHQVFLKLEALSNEIKDKIQQLDQLEKMSKTPSSPETKQIKLVRSSPTKLANQLTQRNLNGNAQKSNLNQSFLQSPALITYLLTNNKEQQQELPHNFVSPGVSNIKPIQSDHFYSNVKDFNLNNQTQKTLNQLQSAVQNNKSFNKSFVNPHEDNNNNTTQLVKESKYQDTQFTSNYKHKKYYKFDIENCNLKEIELIEKIKPLLEGEILFKKFNTQSISDKFQVYDPLNQDLNPEQCGYGHRVIRLNYNLNTIVFKYVAKYGKDIEVKISDIQMLRVPQVSKEIVKIQKKTDYADSINVQLGIESFNKNKIESLKSCSNYPIDLVLKYGDINLVAPNYQVFIDLVTGINAIAENKKLLDGLKLKIHTYSV